MSLNNKTLLSRRYSKARELDEWSGTKYDSIVGKGDEQFFTDLEGMDEDLARKFEKAARVGEIDAAAREFKKAYQSACMAARKRCRTKK